TVLDFSGPRSRTTSPQRTDTRTGVVTTQEFHEPLDASVPLVQHGPPVARGDCHGAARRVALPTTRPAQPNRTAKARPSVRPTAAARGPGLRRWVAARVGPGGRAVRFYAGQTIALPPAPAAPPGTPGRTFCLPVDADLGKPELTGWHLDAAIDPWAATGRNPV